MGKLKKPTWLDALRAWFFREEVEGLRADVKRLEGECEAWEDIVDAMLEAVPKERRGVGQHGATEEIAAAVRSYEAEIQKLIADADGANSTAKALYERVERVEKLCEDDATHLLSLIRDALPRERVGQPGQAPVAQLKQVVRSYEEEIVELKAEVRQLQNPAETRITCISWKDHAEIMAAATESVSVDAIA